MTHLCIKVRLNLLVQFWVTLLEVDRCVDSQNVIAVQQ